MNIENLAANYCKALEQNDYQKIVTLFKSDAIINSPLLGQKTASNFYQELFEKAEYDKVILKKIFTKSFNPNIFAIYLNIEAKKPQINFECIDLFEIDENGKIIQLTIILEKPITQ